MWITPASASCLQFNCHLSPLCWCRSRNYISFYFLLCQMFFSQKGFVDVNILKFGRQKINFRSWLDICDLSNVRWWHPMISFLQMFQHIELLIKTKLAKIKLIVFGFFCNHEYINGCPSYTRLLVHDNVSTRTEL